MTAPLAQRIRCLFSGHDWRRAIGPRQGYYLRCRRCWITEQEETEPQPESDIQSTRLQHHA